MMRFPPEECDVGPTKVCDVRLNHVVFPCSKSCLDSDRHSTMCANIDHILHKNLDIG